MCSAWDTAHTNSVCAFTCPLPLWPERVVACRVSLSSVSSGCAKLLLVESGFPDLFFVMISLGFARFFINTLDRLFWCFWSSRSFSPAQTAFLIEFFVPSPNLHCCWRLFWELPRKCMLRCVQCTAEGKVNYLQVVLHPFYFCAVDIYTWQIDN